MIWPLARHLLESTVFALVAAALALSLQKRSASARHVIWLVAAGKFALPFELITYLGARIRELVPATHLPNVNSIQLTPFLHGGVAMPSARFGLFSGVILLCWIAGTVRLLSTWLRRLCAPIDTDGAVSDFDRMALSLAAQRLKIHRPVKLRASRLFTEPGLIGLFRPTLVIPEGLSMRLTRTEFEAVLLHELAHARRWDNLTNAFAYGVKSFFWFHPLLWWIEGKLLKDSELACDELVVSCGAGPRDYVSGILKVCRLGIREPVPGISRVSGSDLEERMELIMSHQNVKEGGRIGKIFASSLALPLLILPLGAGFLGAQRSSSVSCLYNGASFLEGTVIQAKGSAEQMCARGSSGNAVWIRTSPDVRARSQEVVALPPDAIHVCDPKPSSSGTLCACQDGVYSPGSIVKAKDAKGRLRCAAGKWEASR